MNGPISRRRRQSPHPVGSDSAAPSALSLADDTDVALLRKLRRGGEIAGAAFDTLVRVHYRPLVAYAQLDAGSLEAAEEVVQDVLVAVWERRDRLTITTNLRRYLYGAVRNRAVSAALRDQRAARTRDRLQQVAMGIDVAGVNTPAPAADHVLELAELETAIRNAIDQLPPRARATLRLRWERQLTYAEIARELGLTVKTVEIRIRRALQALRSRLAPFR